MNNQVQVRSDLISFSLTSFQVLTDVVLLFINLAAKYNTTMGPKVIAMSPNFPESYGPNINCTWTIIPRKDDKPATITLSWLEIETSTNCSKDRLEIRNGDSKYSPPFPRSPYCGSLEDLKISLYGTDKRNVNFYPNQSVWIKFVSDQSKDNMRGFLVTYESKRTEPIIGLCAVISALSLLFRLSSLSTCPVRAVSS